jgi:hypothetical protein
LANSPAALLPPVFYCWWVVCFGSAVRNDNLLRSVRPFLMIAVS